MLHMARWRCRTQKSPKNRHLGTITQLCRAMSSQLRQASTIGKNLLNSSISSTCPHHMVNFGLLSAEIVSLVWGTPGNFNGFRVFGRVNLRLSSSGRQPNCGVEQRAPPIFGRATIRLGIGPHSSSFFFSSPNLSRRSTILPHMVWP